MIVKLFKIIKKNFLLLLRSKASALIVILGPLILIALIGIAFSNTNLYAIDMTVYSEDYTNLTHSILGKLRGSQFSVEASLSEEDCVNAVKLAESNICVVFPPRLDIYSNATNEIIFYVDYSKINLVWMVLDVISTKVSARSTEISAELTSDLLRRLSNAKLTLENELPVLIELSSKNKETEDELNKISSNLNSLDLTINLADFKVDDIEERAESIKNYGMSAISEGKQMITSVRSEINSLDNLSSSEEGDINAILDSAELDLENIRLQLEADYSATTSDSLNGLIDNLNSKLESVKSKLDQAASARNGISSDIDKIKELIDQSLDKINHVQTTVNSIITDIESIAITNATTISTPITTKIKSITTEKTHFNFLFPTLIVLVIMITGVLLASTLVINEKKSKSFFRNYITPTGDTIFVVSTYFTALIILVIQLIIFLGISAYFFKTDIIPSIFVSAVIFLMVMTFFILIGMFIGYLLKSAETTTLTAITVCSLFLFFSNTVLPLESMPAYVRGIAVFNPFVISADLLRESIFFRFGFEALQTEIIYLGIYIVATFIIALGTLKLFKVHILYHLHKASRKRRKRLDEEKKMRNKVEVFEETKEEKKKKKESKKKGKGGEGLLSLFFGKEKDRVKHLEKKLEKIESVF